MTLKRGLLIEVGCLIEVQYKLDRNGSKHDFIDYI